MAYRRSIKNNKVFEIIRGGTGTIPITDEPLSRDALISGTYNPVYYSGRGGNYSTARVGIYGLNTMTSETEGSNITFSTNGQTVSNTIFYRRVSVTGQNITFVNCLFLGSITENTALVNLGNVNAINTQFIDCTFCAQAPQSSTVGLKIGAGGVTLLRCDIYGVIDGIQESGTWTNPVKLIQSAIHDLLYFSPDPGARGGISDNAGHVDCVQMSGGSLEIEGSGLWGFLDMSKLQASEQAVNFGADVTLENGTQGPPYHLFGNKYTNTVPFAGDSVTPAAVVGAPSIHTTSCIMTSPYSSDLNVIKINNSFFDGATYIVNLASRTAVTQFDFTNNKIGRNRRSNNTQYRTLQGGATSLNNSINATGNTKLDTGGVLSKGDLL